MDQYFRTLITALAFFLQTELQAQDAELVNMDFKVFGLGKDNYDSLYYFNGTQYESLVFNRHGRSKDTYNYRGIPSLNLYVSNPDVDLDDPASPPYLQVGQYMLPQGIKKGLLVLYAAKDNRNSLPKDRTYQIYLLNDSDQDFPENTIMFLNTTGAPLHGKIGEERIQLPLGASPPISYGNYNLKGKSMRVAFAIEQNGTAKLVMSNDINLPPHRKVLFILQPPKKKNSYRINVRMLTTTIDFEAKEKKL